MQWQFAIRRWVGVPAPAIPPYNGLMHYANLVVVQTFGSRPEAELAKGALKSARIDAMVQADTAGGMREHLAWSGGGFKLLVREEDAVTAREALKPKGRHRSA